MNTQTPAPDTQAYPKNIYSFNGLYTVLPNGIIDIAAGRMPPPPEFYLSREGVPAVMLSRPTTRGKYRKVRLLVKEVVAKAFVPNEDPLHLRRVRVLDRDEHNLAAHNLEWIDPRKDTNPSSIFLTRSRPKQPSPTGWTANSRRLPDGRMYKRNARSYPVAVYKAVPVARTVKAGAMLRIYPSSTAAAKATNCSTGGIHHCCEYWHLMDGMGTTSLEIKGYGTVVDPCDLPTKSRVACSPTKQYVFKWVGFKDKRLHPVAVVIDYEQQRFYPSVAAAARALHHVYDTPDECARILSAVAAASPMYDDPSAAIHPHTTNPWPDALTCLGRVNVFYI